MTALPQLLHTPAPAVSMMSSARLRDLLTGEDTMATSGKPDWLKAAPKSTAPRPNPSARLPGLSQGVVLPSQINGRTRVSPGQLASGHAGFDRHAATVAGPDVPISLISSSRAIRPHSCTQGNDGDLEPGVLQEADIRSALSGLDRSRDGGQRDIREELYHILVAETRHIGCHFTLIFSSNDKPVDHGVIITGPKEDGWPFMWAQRLGSTYKSQLVIDACAPVFATDPL